jgi:hypothetical protein
VPLSEMPSTIQRSVIEAGQVIHLLPPVYHGDRLTGLDSVLAFRDYGMDILERLLAAGFESAQAVRSPFCYFGYARTALVARKPAKP